MEEHATYPTPRLTTGLLATSATYRHARPWTIKLVLSFQTSPDPIEFSPGVFGLFTLDGIYAVKETAKTAFRASHLAFCHLSPDFMSNPKVQVNESGAGPASNDCIRLHSYSCTWWTYDDVGVF